MLLQVIKPEGSIPCSQESATFPCLQPYESSPRPPKLFKLHFSIILLSMSSSHFLIPCQVHTFYPPPTKQLDASLFSPTRATCLTTLIFLDLITLIIYYIQDLPKKCIHTLTKENSTLYNRLLQIYNIFPSTQQYDICIYFNITYIIILATCFDSCESSLGINIQELLVHIVLQFFMS